jgi:hypothetical protein
VKTAQCRSLRTFGDSELPVNSKIVEVKSWLLARGVREVHGRRPQLPERQLVALAYDLAEEQIREGSATAQVITHFLKLGSIQAKLELKKLEGENRLLEAKVESLASSAKTQELYQKALEAFTSYKGRGAADESEE